MICSKVIKLGIKPFLFLSSSFYFNRSVFPKNSNKVSYEVSWRDQVLRLLFEFEIS